MSAPQQLLAGMDGRIVYPIRETFEGSYNSGNGHAVLYFDMPGWTTTSTTVYINYDSAPAPLQGTHSAYPFNASFYRNINLSTASEIWSYAMICRQGALTSGCYFAFPVGVGWEGDGAGGIVAKNGAIAGTAAFPLVIGTVYHVWTRYVPAAVNSVTQVFLSTDGIRPGTAYSEVLNGTATTKNGDVRIAGPNQSPRAMIFDCILVAPFEIGNNPVT